MSDIIGSIHPTPDAAIAAIRDYLGERLAVGVRPTDLVGSLVVGAAETRIIGVRPAPGAWVETIEEWAQLVGRAPWDALQLVAAYAEDDAVVVVHQHGDGVTRHRGVRTADDEVLWVTEPGTELDLAPTITW